MTVWDVGREIRLLTEFCRENYKYWLVDSRSQKIDSEKIIVVDLMVRDGASSIRPMVLAKFLQRYYGYKIVGLAGWTDLIRGIYRIPHLDTTLSLAKSFGITEFISVDTPANEDFSVRVSVNDKYSELSAFDLAEEIEGCSEEEAKRRLLSWRSHSGSHIGRHVLTTAQRSAYTAQFEVYKKILPRIIKETLYLHNYFDELFRRYDVRAAVMSHTCYNVWGLFGDIATANDVPLFPMRFDSDLSVAVIREAPTGSEMLGSIAHRAEASIFHDYIWPNRTKLRATAEKVFDYINSGNHLSPPWWVKGQERSVARTVDRQSVMHRLGWLEDKPVYSVLSHAMTDDVHPDAQAFSDSHDWLRETLAFAADDDSRYWLVKRHPHDRTLDDTNAFGVLAQKYRDLPHIRFVGDELSKAELFTVTSLALTVRGSLGFDFAAAGTPVILSGRSAMSDIGFASVADDSESYFALLRKPLEELAITQEQIERARLYIMCSRLVMRVPSDFLPSMNVSKENEWLWVDMNRRLVTANVETDNYYRNMVRCLELGLPWIVNIEFLQLVNDSQAFQSSDNQRQKVFA